MPPYQCLSIYFMKDIIRGSRKLLPCDGIRYLSLPQFDSLSTGKIMQWAHDHGLVEQYLPEASEHKRLPRQWVINVINTLHMEEFSRWSHGKIEERHLKL